MIYLLLEQVNAWINRTAFKLSAPAVVLAFICDVATYLFINIVCVLLS